MKFSQRIGVIAASKEIQKESIDSDLKNGLWNILHALILEEISDQKNYQFDKIPLQNFRIALYHHFFKLPLDRAPNDKSDIVEHIRINYFKVPWFEIYDLIEFIINEVTEQIYEIDVKTTSKIFNGVLEREFSAYRLINLRFAPITNNLEIQEINAAQDSSNDYTALRGCNVHLKTAFTLLSDRKNPDYRNSIKESISAVEALVKVVGNNKKGSLGDSIDKIKGNINLHPALERGFKQIYGYTSDADGIRHALMEQSSCDFTDAKFMLVSCSAFINYLIAKISNAGISLH